MRAGRLDNKIAIQRKSTSVSEGGDQVDVWSDLFVVWASFSALAGAERFGGDQWVGKEQVEFRVRWSSEIADLSTLDRIVFPTMGGDSPGADITPSRVYDIMAALPIGHNEGFRILASRRADVAP